VPIAVPMTISLVRLTRLAWPFLVNICRAGWPAEDYWGNGVGRARTHPTTLVCRSDWRALAHKTLEHPDFLR
jgi:hypothetical protein